MDIFNSIFLIILLISSYTDIKTRIISNKLMIISCIIGTVLNIYYDKSYVYVVFSLILFVILLLSPIQSGGDIKLLSISVMFVRDALSSFFFILAFICLIIIVYHKLKKQKINKLPLAPYILTTYIINIIIINLL